MLRVGVAGSNFGGERPFAASLTDVRFCSETRSRAASDHFTGWVIMLRDTTHNTEFLELTSKLAPALLSSFDSGVTIGMGDLKIVDVRVSSFG